MKKYYINTNTIVLKSSEKNYFRIPVFFLIAFALFFCGLNGEAQTVNKQLYLKSGLLLNRTVPVSGTSQLSVPLYKTTAIYLANTSGSTSNSGSSGSLTISHTTGTSLNRLMVVTIASKPDAVITSVTYGGISLIKLGEQSNGITTKSEMWYLLNPTSGTANVVISWPGTLEAAAGVTTFSSVNQTTPFGTFVGNSGSTIPTSLSVPSNLGDIILDVIGKNGNAPTVVASTPVQNQIFALGTNSIKVGSSYKTSIAGSTPMSWNASGGTNDWSSVGVSIKGDATDAIFTLTPNLCSSFTIPAGQTITVKTYYKVTSGSMTASPPITSRLRINSIPFFISTTPTASATGGVGTSGYLTWTGTLPSPVTISTSDVFSLRVYNDAPGMEFKINYDAISTSSQITLPTTTYINVNSLNVYNAAYSGGTTITQQAVGVPNYIRAVVSDPFGTSDITGLDFSINGGALIAGNLVNTAGCTKTYEYSWTPTVAGTYSIVATAKEGTEGTVTHSSTIGSFLIKQPSLTVIKTKTSPVSGPFTINDNIVYNIAINNTGLSPLTLLPLQDTYSTSCLQYVSSSVTATNISGGVITWNNLGSLTAGSTLNLTLTMKVIGNCDPATNTATVAGAKDGLNYVATTQTSSLNINIDQPPVAATDSYCIQASTALNVLGNDTDPDLAGFLSANTGLYTVSITTPPLKGAVIVNPDKTIQFNPAGGTAMSENNTVTFVYRVTEIANPTYFSEATVTVLFSAINSAPSAVNDIASTTTGKPVVINVLGNDSDPDGILQAPTVTVQPLYGSVLVNADKTITYTPFTGFEGTDSFTYQVCDNGCPTPTLCATATAAITVVFAQYVCQEGTNTLSVPPISDAVSYTWTLPAGAIVSGTYSGSLPNPTTTSPSITVNWSGVTAGNYNICALASNECGPGANQCTQLVVSKVQLSFAPTQIGCYGNNTGVINLTVSGGIAPYTYAWTRSGGYTASIEDISNLLPGTYNVTVTDKNGCTASGSSIISQPVSPISISVNTITNENPYGSSNGAIDINVSGGTSGYTYSWSNGTTTQDISGLTGATYSVSVTDLNGCTANQIFTVNRIGAPLAISSLTKTDVLCNGSNTGSVNLEVIGGTLTYTYLWTASSGGVIPSGQSGNQDLTGLVAGTYSVTVNDGTNPSVSQSVTIIQPISPLSASNTFTNVTCNGSPNGSINVTVTGGTAPYTYLWSNGVTTEDLSGLSLGTYTVTVTDKNGCTTTTSATITQPTALLLTGTVINSNCNPGNNGAINISVSGGSGSYTFLWSNGSTTQNVSGLAPGGYSVTATDGSGCKVSRAFSVSNSCLGTAKTISGTPINNGNGTYTLTYVIKVQNTGTVTLNNVQVIDDLASTFTGATSFAVNTISSGDFTVNNSFNGNGNNNLLASPFGSLLPGDVGIITLVLNVTPGTKLGIYNNNATASATDPNGLNVSDVSQNGTNVDPDSNGNPGNNSVSTPITFTENPLIGVAKELTSGPTINTDGSYNLTFTIRVHNYGDVPLKNVQVTDNLLTTFDAGATISVTSLTSSDMNINSPGYNGTTDTNLLLGTDVMAVNEVNTIQLSLKVTPSGAGPFNNSAIGTASGLGGTTTTDISQNGINPDPDNNSNPTDNNVSTPVTFPENPQIGIAKQLVGTPVNNHNGTYTLIYEFRVKNTGDVVLHDVQVTDNLTTTFGGKPVTVNSISSTSTPTFTVNGSYNGTSNFNMLAATGNTLDVGQTKLITLNITITPGSVLGVYNNSATASGKSPFNTSVSDISTNGADVDPENNGPADNSVLTPVTFTEAPKMGLAKNVNTVTNNNDGTYTVNYTIYVKNMGDVPLTNVQVTDNLNTTFTGTTSYAVQTVSATGGLIANSVSGFNGTNNLLIASSSAVAYNTTESITLTVKVTPGTTLGIYNNSANGTATGPGGTPVSDVSYNGTNPDPDNDGNPYNNSLPTPVSFSENPQINISKSLTSGPTLSGGNYTLTYRLTVKNTGDVPLSNVQVVEDLLSTFPAPATVVSASATSTGFTINGSYNGTTNVNLLSSLQTLAYNTTKTIDVTVTVNPGGVGGPYVNEAFAYGQSPVGRFANNVSNTVSVTFFEHPKIGIAKKFESVVDNLDGTNTITCLLTIENFGDVELKDLKIYDDIVTQFASVSPTAYFATGGTLFASGTWNGTSTSNILYSGQTLGVGQTATMYISFKVTPGTVCSLNNVASAKGTSPSGTKVSEDISTNGTDPDGSTVDGDPVEQVPTPVIFVDNQKPVVTCPTPLSLYSTDDGKGDATLTFTATATDNCDTDVALTYSVGGLAITFPYTFPTGTTTVDVLADDGNGNTDGCSFDVFVLPLIDAVADAGSSVNGYTGGISFGNVLTNDVLGGSAVALAQVNLSQISSTNAGVSLDPTTGAVNVAAGTPAGNYTLVYQICEKLNPTNCDQASVTVPVSPAVIDAVDGSGTVNGRTGGATIADVLYNDLLNGVLVSHSQVTLTLVSSTHANVTLNTTTGAVNVAPGTPAGTYYVTYRICEVLNPSNCDDAISTAIVTASPILAGSDAGSSVNGYAGGTSFTNVLGNDLLNGTAVVPADVNLTFISSTNPNITLSGSNVLVAAGTPAGTYTLVYQICEILNPANCSQATVIVPVSIAPLVAVADAGSAGSFTGGVAVANVLSNDLLNGVAVVPSEVNLSSVSSTNAGITLNATTGAVSVAAGTAAGTYILTYQICEILNPSNCTTANVTVTVTAPVIDAVADAGGPVVGMSGGVAVSDVLVNDLLAGALVDPFKVNLSFVSSTNVGITLSGSSVVVAAGTPAGTYTLVYQICEKLNPASCDQATVTVTVTAAALVVTADAGSVNGMVGGIAISAVLNNDLLNGVPVVQSDIILTQVSSTSPNVTLNITTGAVVVATVAPGTPAGTYTLVYQVCEKLNPTNCSTGTVTVTVTAAPLVAVDDLGNEVNSISGGNAVSNVLNNDQLNGLSVVASDVTISFVSSTNANVTLNTSTGAVNVAAGTPEGTYTLVYQICEVLNPTNCKQATVTVPVNLDDLIAINDAGSTVNGFTGGTSLTNVLGNDQLNGLAVDPASVSLSFVSSTNANVTLNTTTGSVNVAAGTPAGTYSLVYQICDNINPSNCSQATVTVPVSEASISGVNDSGSSNGYTGGTAVTNVLSNDLLNGAAVDPAKVTVSYISSTSSGVTLSGSNVVVAAGTPAGTYILTYEICELLNASNCDQAEVTVTVVAPVIDAVADAGSASGLSGGVAVNNVLGNDLLGGSFFSPAKVALSFVSSTNGGVSLSGSNVVVAAGTPAGTYTLTYQICEILNPTNCDQTTVSVTVTSATIDAVADAGSIVNGYTGGTSFGNVLTNDLLGGSAVALAQVNLSQVSSTSSGVTLNTLTGAVNVAAGTPAGNYTLTYQICEKLNPTNCDQASVTVPVSPAVIDAVDGSGTVNGRTGGATIADVLYNDLLNGVLVSHSQVTLTLVSSTHANVTLNTTTGAVNVAPGTPAGTYYVTYRICEVLNPSNCDDAISTAIVTASPILAGSDAGSSVNGYAGGTSFTNVLGNDLLNGTAVVPADVNLTFISSTNPNITLSGSNVLVAAGTPAGTYTLVYQICEILNPANCSQATVIVPVSTAPIAAVVDSGSANGFTGGTALTNVLSNDLLNGTAVNPADVALTFVSSTNSGVTLSGSDVLVAAGTPAGSYILVYQICEILNPTNCSLTYVTVATVAVASITDATEIEGTDLIHTVLMTETSGTAETYAFGAADVTATAGADYTSTLMFSDGVTYAGGFITVPAGVTTFTVTFPGLTDLLDENNETYTLSVGGQTATGTITDDDTAAVASVSDATEIEGTDLTHTVAMTGASATAETYAFSIADVTATSGADYTSTTVLSNGVTYAGGFITVPAGVVTFTASFPGLTDLLSENNETYTLSVGGIDATGTIVDDDTAPTVSISDVSVTEGTAAVFTVSISGVSSQVTVVDVVTATGTAGTSDYTTTSTTVTIPAGSTSVTVSVPTIIDTVYESTEQFTLNGTVTSGNTSNQTVIGIGTILDNDLAQKPSIALIKTATSVDENGDGYTAVGEKVTYNFAITNTGNVPLSNITISDILPGIVITGGPISLLPGGIDTNTFVGTYAITANDLLVGSITNQATVYGTSPTGIIVQDLSDSSSNTSDEGTVLGIERCKVEVFNAVSPNGDGKNDIFRVEGLECYPENSVEIYNRWGVLVFEREKYNNLDRAFRGISEGRVTIKQSEELPVETYFYIVRYKEVDGKVYEKSGYLYLNRK